MRVGIIIVLFTALALPSTLTAEEIILAADPWPPFNIEPGKALEGYMVDVAREVLETYGHSVIYKIVPWKRAIDGTRTGRYTGAIGASKNDAAGFVFPEEALARNVLAFYTLAGNPWRFQGPASIENVIIGVAAGYDYRRWLNDYIRAYCRDEQRVQVIAGKHPLRQNLKKLLLQRIEVVVDNEAAIRFTANQMNVLEKIKAAGYGQEPADIYIAFSPALPQGTVLAHQLSEGIVELRRRGRLQVILDRYGLNDWK